MVNSKVAEVICIVLIYFASVSTLLLSVVGKKVTAIANIKARWPAMKSLGLKPLTDMRNNPMAHMHPTKTSPIFV